MPARLPGHFPPVAPRPRPRPPEQHGAGDLNDLNAGATARLVMHVVIVIVVVRNGKQRAQAPQRAVRVGRRGLYALVRRAARIAERAAAAAADVVAALRALHHVAAARGGAAGSLQAAREAQHRRILLGPQLRREVLEIAAGHTRRSCPAAASSPSGLSSRMEQSL